MKGEISGGMWMVVVGAFVAMIIGGIYIGLNSDLIGKIGGVVEGTVDCSGGLIVSTLAVPDEQGNYGVCAPDCNALPKDTSYIYQNLGKAGCESGMKCCVRIGTGEGGTTDVSQKCSNYPPHPCRDRIVDEPFRLPTERCAYCIAGANGDLTNCLLRIDIPDDRCPS